MGIVLLSSIRFELIKVISVDSGEEANVDGRARVQTRSIYRSGEKERRHGHGRSRGRMEELVLDRAFDRERAGEQVAQTEA